MNRNVVGRAGGWVLVAAYLIGMGVWAYRAGMDLRDDVWRNTRTLREENNISAGFRWGQQVLRTAERTAKSPEAAKWRNPGDPAEEAVAVPKPGANQRALTFWELLRGEDQLYQDLLMGRTASGDFDLDYPPARLLMMTLWARHTEGIVAGIDGWPGLWRLRYNATGDQKELAYEDLARPLILGNTYAIAASSAAAFFLVWVWVNRGSRPTLPGRAAGWRSWLIGPRRLVPWKATPIWQANGLAVFGLSAWAFFHAMIIAESPCPTPPPAIAFAGPPILVKQADGKVTATICALFDDQSGDDAQWKVDWGRTPLYENHSASQLGEGGSVTLAGLPADALIHYRLTAQSDYGFTHTDDQTFSTAGPVAPQPPMLWYGAVWLSWQQWLGIGLLLALMSGSMGVLPPEHRGWAAGMAAAFLMWLNPAVLLDTHIWPQWDAWALVPFFVGALLASVDWWFTAGLVLGAGVMFKGQLLLVAPLLLLWPLFAGRVGAAVRIGIGAILSAGVVLSPWVVLGNLPPTWTAGPMRWIPAVALAAAIAGGLSFYRRKLVSADASVTELVLIGCSVLGGIVVATLLILRHWPADSELPKTAGLFLLLGILLPPWILPRRAMGVWMAGVLAAALWMSAFVFHGDWSWKAVGFDYGTRKHTMISVTPQVMGNLPVVLSTRFGWDVYDPAVVLRPPDLADLLHWPARKADGTLPDWAHNSGWDGTPVTLDFRTVLIVVFVLMIVLSAAGAAAHSRNDPRVLASLAAVWVLMPNVLCQMHVRYQMWAAAASAILIGLSPGLGVVHILITLFAAGMMASARLTYDNSRSPKLHDLMNRFRPDDGWIMLLLGLVILYFALAPGRRARREELSLP